MVYASGADLESANPLVTVHNMARQVQRYALFVTLARYDSLLAPQPYAAREWRWTSDRRRLTFHLEPGLRWHDGRPTTARDAAFTIDAARDPATGYPRYGDLAHLVAVEATDDSTLVLSFAAPQPAFPLVFCELPLLPAHLLGDVPRSEMRRAAFNLAPVGNGPFRFVTREAGRRWVFERNEEFPASLGGPPGIRRFVVAVVDEATTKFAGLVSGALDVAGIAPTQAELVAADPALRVVTYPVLFATAIVFNTSRPPFDSPLVREALDLSVDRQRIIDAALAGFAIPAAGPVPPGNPLALEATARHEPAVADSLLDAAGWPRGTGGWRERGGQRLAFTLLTVGSADNAIEQLLQADLADRGIRMEIRQMEHGAFLGEARASERRFDALITGVPGDLSLSYVSGMYDGRLAGGALDYGGFHTPALDRLFGRIREAEDERAIGDGWRAVQRELARERPAVWLYHSRGLQGISGRLEGVEMDLRGELPTLARWTVGARAGQTSAHR
ncbi:MAG TPA: peptide ABC transporter substrate-binding protein [Gemmatimonadaceae bacterium]|nr:peptide ABC transporter substrate-binding protein [Gemmatimonadaceae bacterium]